MKTFWFLFCLFVWAVVPEASLAQGPGPGPVPSPWIVNGPQISFGGCVTVPVTVTGGCMGNGTINAGQLYVNGNPLVSSVVNSDGSLTVAQSAGTVTVSLNTSHANVWTAVPTVNLNAVVLPTSLVGTGIRLGGVDSVDARVENDGFGASAYFSTVRTDGTNATKTAIQSGDEIGGFNAWGYNGTAVVGPSASLRVWAAENWSSGHQGSYADIAATPIGGTSEVSVVKFFGGFPAVQSLFASTTPITTMVNADWQIADAGSHNVLAVLVDNNLASDTPDYPTAISAIAYNDNNGNTVYPFYSETHALAFGVAGNEDDTMPGSGCTNVPTSYPWSRAFGQSTCIPIGRTYVANHDAINGTGGPSAAAIEIASKQTTPADFFEFGFVMRAGGVAQWAGWVDATSLLGAANGLHLGYLGSGVGLEIRPMSSPAEADALHVLTAGGTVVFNVGQYGYVSILDTEATMNWNLPALSVRDSGSAGAVIQLGGDGTNPNFWLQSHASVFNILATNHITVLASLDQSGDTSFAGTFTLPTFATAGAVCNSAAGLFSSVTGKCPGNDPSDVTSVSNSDGTLTISPTTGAVVASLNLSHANTVLAAWTFTNSDIKLLGSSTGATTLTSANASATNYTLTIPAATDTMAVLALAQALTNKTITSSTNILGGVTMQLGADAVGDVYYAGASEVLTRLADVAVGSALISGGVGIAPSWGAYAAAAGTLTGTTLNSAVVTSSLTTVGTIGTGTWQGSLIAGTYGGTGVNNGAKTITIGASLATTGAGAATFVLGASTQSYTFPTVTDTIPGLGQANAFTGNESHSGSEAFTNTTAPTMAAGSLFVDGTHAAATFGANGEGDIFLTAGNGVTVQGKGSSYDFVVDNQGGNQAIRVPTGTQTLNIVGAGSAAAPALVVGGATTGIYNVSTTGLGLSVNGVVKGDYGITNAGGWTFAGSLALPGLASSSVATTGTLCWSTSTGNITVNTTVACLASLEELKDIRAPILGAEALAEVERLRPVWGTWRKATPEYAGDRAEQPFLTAHQVESVDRRLVGYDTEGKLSGVRYMEMSAVLVAAVQQLTEQNSKIKAANDNMERRIERLERRMR